MKKVKAILELGKDGYGVSFPEIENIFGFGETLEAAKDDAQKVLDFYISILNKSGKNIPEFLKGEYELEFTFDTVALFKHIDGIVTKTALAKASGVNQTQLTHYSSGLKKPRKEQREKIINGLHKLAQELLSVS